MAARHINPIVKLVLEVGPIAVFFLAYRLAPLPAGLGDSERQLQQILFSTAVFVPTILAALAASWFLSGKLPRMAVITAVVVTIFGGLTLILRDDTFVKMKPTILYAPLRRHPRVRAAARAELPALPDGRAHPDAGRGLDEVHPALRGLLPAPRRRQRGGLAGVGTDTWVNFRTFVLPAANFLFIMAQVPLFQRYAIAEQASGPLPPVD